MKPDQLRSAIEDLRLSQRQFASLVMVSGGAVAQWLSGARKIPGPVISFLTLLNQIPLERREAFIREMVK